jgi:microcystin degradation protein MlrC
MTKEQNLSGKPSVTLSSASQTNAPKIAPRVAVGGILHETHSFADPKTSLAHFQHQALHYGQDLLDTLGAARSAIGGMIQAGSERGWTLLPTAYGAAMPGGVVVESAYQEMLDELIRRLTAAAPVDGVLLALHGAMVTEEHLDPETHILEEVRKVVGPDVPIIVVLDMHGNISQESAALADVLIAFNTNPHIDPHARGMEAVDVMARLLAGDVRPTAAHVALPLILSPQATGTDDLPLRAVHGRAVEMKSTPEVVSICVMGGFAYADTPFTGVSIIVTTNQNEALAERYAQELASSLWQQRDSALPQFLAPQSAVAQALAQPEGPVLLVDSADNIGGGTPGDGTDALRAMLDLGVEEGAIVLADAEAVAACVAAGEGAEISLAVGSKTDEWHGETIQVTGVVRKLSNGVFTCELPDNHFASFYGTTVDMGSTAWLRVQGVNIILTERKTPPFDLAQLRHIGVIPEQQKMIVVKSAVAYRAAYLPIATATVEMDTAGLCTANLFRFPYQHLTRPLFPLDPVPDLGTASYA